MPYAQLSTGRVHYEEQGRGVPLVLLSANPGEGRDFAAVIPDLARYYRVLALDWPGYGASDAPQAPETFTVLHFYRALREFLEVLELAPALFIGNSAGGNAAARLAIEAPGRVRGLVLAAGGGFTPQNFITRAFCGLMGSRFALPPGLWASLYLRKRSAVVREMIKRAATMQSTAPRLALNRALWRSFGREENDLRHKAAAITAPTLLVYGRDDPALPAGKDGQVAARCIAQSRLAVMPCGHAAFAELPQQFLMQVLPFLAECTADTSAAVQERAAA